MTFKKRGILVAAGTIGALYLARTIGKDIARYNKLATMSGDKPLMADQVDKLKRLAGLGGRNGSG